MLINCFIFQKLLQFIPNNRISAKEALNHRYFRGLNQPRISASSNRSTPTTQILSQQRYGLNSPSIIQHPVSTDSSTVPITTSIDSASLRPQPRVANDENNLNIGNNANTTPTSVSYLNRSEPK